jgi:hypothetical protein
VSNNDDALRLHPRVAATQGDGHALLDVPASTRCLRAWRLSEGNEYLSSDNIANVVGGELCAQSRRCRRVASAVAFDKRFSVLANRLSLVADLMRTVEPLGLHFVADVA